MLPHYVYILSKTKEWKPKLSFNVFFVYIHIYRLKFNKIPQESRCWFDSARSIIVDIYFMYFKNKNSRIIFFVFFYSFLSIFLYIYIYIYTKIVKKNLKSFCWNIFTIATWVYIYIKQNQRVKAKITFYVFFVYIHIYRLKFNKIPQKLACWFDSTMSIIVDIYILCT